MKVQRTAIELVQKEEESSIFQRIGQIVPYDAIKAFLEVEQYSLRQLTHDERKLLPKPSAPNNDYQKGRTVFSALRLVVWRSLCDPESDVYKMWFTNGVNAVFDKKIISIAVCSTLGGFKICNSYLAAYIVAIIMKFGLDVFCELYKPKNIMSLHGRKI